MATYSIILPRLLIFFFLFLCLRFLPLMTLSIWSNSNWASLSSAVKSSSATSSSLSALSSSTISTAPWSSAEETATSSAFVSSDCSEFVRITTSFSSKTSETWFFSSSLIIYLSYSVILCIYIIAQKTIFVNTLF